MTITKEVVKAEIDKVEDKYLEVLYKIIQALEVASAAEPDEAGWHQFIATTYGSTQDAPLKRGDQGTYEIRHPLP